MNTVSSLLIILKKKKKHVYKNITGAQKAAKATLLNINIQTQLSSVYHALKAVHIQAVSNSQPAGCMQSAELFSTAHYLQGEKISYICEYI